MPDKAFTTYVICTSPRSGSTMLCKLLAATELAGNPASLFHRPSIDAWLKHYDLTYPQGASKQEILEAVFNAALARGKGDTDLFGLRLQHNSLALFLEQLKVLHPDPATDLERIEAAFGPTLFIYLTRDDTLGQAISYVRAEQTGLWHRKRDGTALEKLEPRREQGYDADAIRAQLDEFARFNADWRRWFDEQAIEPFAISYETLSREPQAVVAEILTALGRDKSCALDIQPQTAKLADGTNKDWHTRFHLEENYPSRIDG